MDIDNLISLYVLTQGEIDQLWEFFLISQLALIGWLVTVSENQVLRAKRILTISFFILSVALGYFFYDGYSDLALIQRDIIALLNKKNVDVVDSGFVDQLVNIDFSLRFFRIVIIFFTSFICALYLLNHPNFIGKINQKRV